MALVISLVGHLPVPEPEARRPRGRRGDGRVDTRPLSGRDSGR
jgi:hypothetical protein